MKLIDFIKRKFKKGHSGYSEDELFKVRFVVWVGDPMDSTYPSTDSIMVPKEIINGLEYFSQAEKKIYEYVNSMVDYGCGLTLDDLYMNRYIREVYEIPVGLGQLCPLSDSYKEIINNIKRRG